MPDDCRVSTFADQFLFTPRGAWTFGSRTFPAGSLVAMPVAAFMTLGPTAAAAAQDGVPATVLFTPTPTTSLKGRCGTRNYLLLTVLDTVKSRMLGWRYREGADGGWTPVGDHAASDATSLDSVGCSAVDSDQSACLA